MTKEGDTDLKCVGLVDYCDKKLNDKLMLHFQENKSFHATWRSHQFIYILSEPWKRKFMGGEDGCEEKLELVLASKEIMKNENLNKETCIVDTISRRPPLELLCIWLKRLWSSTRP